MPFLFREAIVLDELAPLAWLRKWQGSRHPDSAAPRPAARKHLVQQAARLMVWCEARHLNELL